MESIATPAEAHHEWHWNTGTAAWRPGFPACPWDCAAGYEDDEDRGMPYSPSGPHPSDEPAEESE